jgi:hypothetical protein
MQCIEQALEKEGITFLNDAFNGVGVQIKPKGANANHATILIVDDSKSDRTLYKNWLSKASSKSYHMWRRKRSCGVRCFRRIQAALHHFRLHDVWRGWIPAACSVKTRTRHQIIANIFVSAMHNDVLAQTANAQGVFCCLDKNKLTQTQLNTSITEALRQ